MSSTKSNFLVRFSSNLYLGRLCERVRDVFFGAFSNEFSGRKFMFMQRKWKTRDEIYRLLMRMFKCTLCAIDDEFDLW